MKPKSILNLALFSVISCTSYAATLQFPVVGINNGDPLDGSWTQSDGVAASQKLGWYSEVTGSGAVAEGVSVGGFYDDYADVTDGAFTVSSNTAAVAVGGATLNWHFAINPSDNGFDASQNDFSISLLDTTSANILTISLQNLDATHYNVYANGFGLGNYMGTVEIDGLYNLYVSFGASSGLNAMVKGTPGFGTLFYSEPAFVTTGKTFGSVELGIQKGSGANFGDGSLTVVPEPGSAMLLGLLPALSFLRRRR